MKKSAASIIVILSVLMLCACAANTAKSADIAVSGEIAVGQSTESDTGEETVTEMKVTNETEVAEREDEVMHNGLEDYTNIEVSGIDIDSLTDEQMEILLLQTQYCQAMTDADTDAMRELVSEDMTYTHMSGKTQTREEYYL